MSAEGGGVAESMGHKLGPLPVWGWVVVIGGGLGLSMLLRKKQTAAVAPSSTVTAPAGGTSGADPGSGPTGISGIVPYLDNNTWGAAVETYLLQAGADPTLADSAVRDYLAGGALSADEQTLIAAALKSVGPPPQILGPAMAPPTVTDPTAPTSSDGGTTAPTPSIVHPGAGSVADLTGPTSFRLPSTVLSEVAAGQAAAAAAGQAPPPTIDVQLPGSVSKAAPTFGQVTSGDVTYGYEAPTP